MTAGRCVFCGAPVAFGRDYQKVICWERKRVQGGANVMHLRQPQEDWACVSCVDKQRAGLNASQEGMGL